MSTKLLKLDSSLRGLGTRCPSLNKVIVHSSSSGGLKSRKSLLGILRSLQVLVGKSGYVIKTKKSVAAFSSREGSEIAISVTLRKAHIPTFIAWLNSEALPMVLSQEYPLLKGIRGKGAPSFGIGVPSNIDIGKLALEPSLAFNSFGFDVNFELNSPVLHKNFIASYIGLPIKKVVV